MTVYQYKPYVINNLTAPCANAKERITTLPKSVWPDESTMFSSVFPVRPIADLCLYVIYAAVAFTVMPRSTIRPHN